MRKHTFLRFVDPTKSDRPARRDMHFVKCERTDLPEACDGVEQYEHFYLVYGVWDDPDFYVGKCHENAPKECVVWYQNGNMWRGCSDTFKDAVTGAMLDAWMYTIPEGYKKEVA